MLYTAVATPLFVKPLAYARDLKRFHAKWGRLAPGAVLQDLGIARTRPTGVPRGHLGIAPPFDPATQGAEPRLALRPGPCREGVLLGLSTAVRRSSGYYQGNYLGVGPTLYQAFVTWVGIRKLLNGCGIVPSVSAFLGSFVPSQFSTLRRPSRVQDHAETTLVFPRTAQIQGYNPLLCRPKRAIWHERSNSNQLPISFHSCLNIAGRILPIPHRFHHLRTVSVPQLVTCEETRPCDRVQTWRQHRSAPLLPDRQTIEDVCSRLWRVCLGARRQPGPPPS